MEMPKITIKVRLKCGREFYDAGDSAAENILSLMRQKTFTPDNIVYLKNFGWGVSYLGDSLFLDGIGLTKVQK